MHPFLIRAESENARVVLAGATRQFSSVPAGRAYAQLLEHGLSSVTLNKILRQDAAAAGIRQAVAEIADGHIREGCTRLLHSGRVYESPDPQQRSRVIAGLYTVLSGETLVVCATNAERQELNAVIRAARIEKGDV